MKNIGKVVDLMNNPLFNVSERKSIIFEKKYKENKYCGKKMKKGKDIVFTTYIDVNALGATLSLGEFEKEFQLRDKIKALIDFDNQINIYYNNLENLSKPKPIFDKTNEIDKHTLAKLFYYLEKWIKYCGIPNSLFEGDEYYLPNDDIYLILDFCYELNDMYNKYHHTDNEACIEYTVKYKCVRKDKKISLINSFPTIVDAMIFYMVIQDKNDLYDRSNIKRCEYCNMYFYGRKNKKTCSQRCKDLKNHKYEKRAENKRQKKIQEGKENDRNNQQK